MCSESPARARGVCRACALATALCVLAAMPPEQASAQNDTTAAHSPLGCADLAAFAGRRIAWIDVVTRAPDPLPGPAAVLDVLHTRTRPDVVRRELAFTTGDSVRPEQIAESLRRLRALPFLADVALTVSSPALRGAALPTRTAASCPVATAGDSDSAAVGLTITTRDAWSTRPNLRLGSATAGSVVGVQERDLMGAGRVGRVYLRADHGRIGLGVGYADPWFLGRDAVAAVSRESYRDGSAWQGSIRTHERTVFDPWLWQLRASSTARATALRNAVSITPWLDTGRQRAGRGSL